MLDKSREPAKGWLLGAVVRVLPKGGYFLREAEARSLHQDVYMGSRLHPKCLPALLVIFPYVYFHFGFYQFFLGFRSRFTESAVDRDLGILLDWIRIKSKVFYDKEIQCLIKGL